jgi:large subunit ribosomal protein L13
VVDATDVSLGRLSVDVATILMGKHRPEYTPHVDCGDFVVVINAAKIGLSGNKAAQKTRMTYSRYPGGEKHETYESLRERRPQKLIEDAVRRMLPKNRLSRHMLTKLKVYPGAEHPHQAQAPVALKVG